MLVGVRNSVVGLCDPQRRVGVGTPFLASAPELRLIIRSCERRPTDAQKRVPTTPRVYVLIPARCAPTVLL
jgi:hypothetical protein